MKTQRNYLQSSGCEIFKIINLARAEKQLGKRREHFQPTQRGEMQSEPTTDPPSPRGTGLGQVFPGTFRFGVDAPVPVPPEVVSGPVLSSMGTCGDPQMGSDVPLPSRSSPLWPASPWQGPCPTSSLVANKFL